ncbi:alanine/glycine:cation symporter family protein [Microbulbifer bruguierae]|uniref:Alanine/glycine:cation symporter family protein n=1 Tax=Microbulbifer bruguierae TaxID=3029061 RepID=A0ABY8NDA2_9GAMM|nr:alanine/glycine:cation symporter family protein [Microbulbifer bruguierae]WGL16905.1 alanine/glycine:cation symporter family protein [Microbulbifer bruguierae]
MQGFLDGLGALVSWGNNLTWGGIGGVWWLGILIVALLPAGVYFTVRTRFVQFRGFCQMLRVMGHSFRKEHDDSVSSFQAFATSAAARVGTGNIAGVAVAITAGGPGAVFWMWVVAMLGMATSLIENTLAQTFKEQGEVHGTFRGGPAYYIDKGLGRRWKWLSIVFSVFLVICFGFFFNAVQSNAMAEAIHAAWGINPLLVGVLISVLAAIIVFGGIQSIGRFAGIVVPIMALCYLAIALFVIFANISRVPEVFGIIISNAFGFQEAGAGAFGAVVANGIKRGLFSNEAGMGSSPNVGAAADVKHPVVQGYVQMASVFLDTMMICSATAAIILLSNVELSGMVEGVTLTQSALSSQVGSWGNSFIALALLFFAFTSIIANYYYAETNIFYLWHTRFSIFCYRALYIAFILFGAWVAWSGSEGNFQLLWNMADMSMGFMASANLLAMLLLSGVALRVFADYEGQIKRGIKEPVFDASRHKIPGIEPDVWRGGPHIPGEHGGPPEHQQKK